MEGRDRLQAGRLAAFIACLALGSQLAAPDDPTGQAKQKPRTTAPEAPAPELPTLTVEQLAERARKSVVVVTVTGRDGRQQGLGSGFVIAADGLVATNLHVIGE